MGQQNSIVNRKGRAIALSLGIIVLLIGLWLFIFWPTLIIRPPVPDSGPFADIFYVNGDGTITDMRTGLMWQETIHKKDRGGRTSAVPPGDNCFGGYCDWRVPTVQELVQLSSHLAEAREFWVNQCCIGDSLKARLCRLCQSDSWLCVRSVDNPVDSSLAPFDGINDDILALDVRNWVEDCDPPRSDCYEEYWEFHEVSLVNGEVSTVTLSVYVNPPYVAGYCTHNWRWLLVRDVG